MPKGLYLEFSNGSKPSKESDTQAVQQNKLYLNNSARIIHVDFRQNIYRKILDRTMK